MNKFFQNRLKTPRYACDSVLTGASKSRVMPMVEIGFRGERFFEFNEAQQLLPLINKMTQHLMREIDKERDMLNRLLPCDPRSKEISARIAPRIERWKIDLERLGCKVFSLDFIGFFNGDCFYLARPTEEQIRFVIPVGAPLREKLPLAKFPFINQNLG